MNRIKRLVSFALAMVLVLSLTACMGKGSRAEGIYYDASGVCADAVLMKINDVDIPAERFFYWLYNSMTALESSYGVEDWTEDTGNGKTYTDFCFEYAETTAKQYAVMEQWAEEHEFLIDEESNASIEQQINAYKEEYGEFIFNYWGITEDTMRYFFRVDNYSEQAIENCLEKDGIFYPTEEELAAFREETDLLKEDHIYFATIDLYSYQPVSDSTAKKQYEKAEKVLKQLKEAENLEETFRKLADQYSEDPGRSVYPEGYTFGSGEMIEEFEAATRALKVGELSDIVETDIGYYIILRKEIGDAELLESGDYFTKVLNNACEGVEVKYSKLYEETVKLMDLGAFYASVTEAQDAMLTEYQASLANGESDSGDPGEETENAAGGNSGETQD